jgi:glycylpeptide N-tetradecanoyltransferase
MTKPKIQTKQKVADKTAEPSVAIKYPTRVGAGKKFKYNFWNNKPVSKFGELLINSERVENDLTNRKVYGSNEPIALPVTMEWLSIDMADEVTMHKIVDFLKLYYLVDSSNKFKLDYTIDFLKWVIEPENGGFMTAIVSKNDKSVCGVVGAYFKNMTVFDKTEKFAVVDFLCAHPIYRKKKIAYTLIDEIVRLIVKTGVNQGCFTTERCVPSPCSVIRYYHRPINYIKLQKFGFTDVGGDPEKVQHKFNIKGTFPENYIQMNESHLPMVSKLYNEFMIKYNVCCNYTEAELKNLLLNKFVNSYVITDKKMLNDDVLDFVSYYNLPYVTLDQEKINSGYLFLYSCNNIAGDELLENLLRIAFFNKLDVFNVTDTMMIPNVLFTKELELDEDSDNESYEHIYEHKFLKGDEKLHFNFFNWKCPEMKSKQLSWTVL